MHLNERFILIIIFLIFAMITGFFLLSPKNPPADNYPAVSPTANPNPIINLVERLKICESIPNGTIQEVSETTRLFINLPEDIYPFENREFTFNGATAGIITSGEGLPPQNGSLEEFVKNKCATHYYEFNGNGTVDLKVKSAVSGVLDYVIHFRVKGESK
jgi:hypothetical protein